MKQNTRPNAARPRRRRFRLERLVLPADADVVIVSGYENDLLRQQVERLRARGNSATVLPVGKEAAAG